MILSSVLYGQRPLTYGYCISEPRIFSRMTRFPVDVASKMIDVCIGTGLKTRLKVSKNTQEQQKAKRFLQSVSLSETNLVV